MKLRWFLAVAVAAFLGLSVTAQMGDDEMASKFFNLINDQAYEYTWHYEPGVEQGFYEGQAPHGAMLRTYANDIAYDAIHAMMGAALPPGSILVKENHTPERELAAVTYMVKIEGYNPEAGDWFWAKVQPDGTLDAAGKPAGCIGCHMQVADNDWVFNTRNLGN